MKVSVKIFFYVVYKQMFLYQRVTHSFVMGYSIYNGETGKYRTEDLACFKGELGKTQLICKEIKEGIYFWKDELQISLGNIMKEDYHELTYIWISH